MSRVPRVISRVFSRHSRHSSSFRRILIGREITSPRDSWILEHGRVSLEILRYQATSVKIECEPADCNSRRINFGNYYLCSDDRSFVAASGDVFISFSSPRAYRATRTISRRYIPPRVLAMTGESRRESPRSVKPVLRCASTLQRKIYTSEGVNAQVGSILLIVEIFLSADHAIRRRVERDEILRYLRSIHVAAGISPTGVSPTLHSRCRIQARSTRPTFRG